MRGGVGGKITLGRGNSTSRHEVWVYSGVSACVYLIYAYEVNRSQANSNEKKKTSKKCNMH